MIIIDGGNKIILDASGGTGYRILNIDAPGSAVEVTLTGLSLLGGSSASEGGAIRFAGVDDTLHLDAITLKDNSSVVGGGLMADGGTVSIRNSTFSNNSAVDGGGASLRDGEFLVVNSTFSGNVASQDGDSIDHVASPTNVSTLRIESSTFVSTDTTGSHINTFADASATANTFVKNSILSDASPDSNIGVPTAGLGTVNVVSLGHNWATDAPASFDTSNGDQINTDPLLSSLRHNGGPTETHGLFAPSSAIDAGDPLFDPNDYTPAFSTDQRGAGFNRVRTAGIDIGAFENQDDHANTFVGATPITEGVRAVGDIKYRDDVDYFSFPATSGHIYDIFVSPGSLRGSALAVYDTNGTTILESAINAIFTRGPSRIGFQPPVSGTYFIKVAGGSFSGTYALNLADVVDDGDDISTATPILAPSITSGDIQFRGDSDFFSFTAEAGSRMNVTVSSGTLDTSRLFIFDPSGAFASPFDSGTVSQVEFRATASGSYFIEVRAVDSNRLGTYTLDLQVITLISTRSTPRKGRFTIWMERRFWPRLARMKETVRN